MRRFFAISIVLALAACEIPEWVAGPPKVVKRAPGERTDIVRSEQALSVSTEAADTAIEIPDQSATDDWISRNEAILSGHLGFAGGKNHESAAIGDGNDFARAMAPPPIVVSGLVFAMDAAGVISAHDVKDIDRVRWRNFAGEEKHSDDVLGGGLAVKDTTLFATTGFGRLWAMDLKTGKTLWKTKVGAPVRGAPAARGEVVVVLTADGQTLAFDAANGTLRWDHRGIRAQAGYFSPTSPMISDDGIVITAYPSGEIFALRVENGSVLWSDTLGSVNRTSASAIFSGIDADPIIQDGVVVVTSAGGATQASALLNGRPLWEQRAGSHQTPWSAGNAVFVLTANHELAALLKRDGSVRWVTKLGQTNARGKDITPPLFGPVLAGDSLLVVRGDGTALRFSPQDGTLKAELDIANDVLTAPVIAGGKLYVIDKDARLHQYY